MQDVLVLQEMMKSFSICWSLGMTNRCCRVETVRGSSPVKTFRKLWNVFSIFEDHTIIAGKLPSTVVHRRIRLDSNLSCPSIKEAGEPFYGRMGELTSDERPLCLTESNSIRMTRSVLREPLT